MLAWKVGERLQLLEQRLALSKGSMQQHVQQTTRYGSQQLLRIHGLYRLCSTQHRHVDAARRIWATRRNLRWIVATNTDDHGEDP
jgi:hypothetical protein